MALIGNILLVEDTMYHLPAWGQVLGAIVILGLLEVAARVSDYRRQHPRELP